MKKKITAIALMLCALMSTTACGGTVVDDIDESKTQIYISVYNGGIGYAWIEKQAKTWNATNDSYEVKIQPEQTTSQAVVQDMALGSMEIDVYYVGDPGLRVAIEKGYAEV